MIRVLGLYNNFRGWPCQTIYTNYWEVECCNGICYPLLQQDH